MAKMNIKILSIIKNNFDEGIFLIDEEGIIYKTLKSGKIVEFGSKHHRGYINFRVTVDGVQYRTFAHRIIYYLHHGVWDDTRIINHLDGNKSNNRIENLDLISQFENIIYSLKNDEIIFEANFIDEITKEKYKLDGNKWELFKKEAYEGYRRHIYSNYTEDHPFYEACKDFDTVEGYKKHINEYFERDEKKGKR